MNSASRLKWGLLLVAAGFVLSEAAQPQKVAASKCFLVKVNDAQRRGLDHYFDPFAAEHNFVIDKRNPEQTEYRDATNGVLIALNPFMGPYGASVALVTDQQSEKCQICELFEVFTKTEVGKSFTVTPCNEVEGFRTPELYNFDLHSLNP